MPNPRERDEQAIERLLNELNTLLDAAEGLEHSSLNNDDLLLPRLQALGQAFNQATPHDLPAITNDKLQRARALILELEAVLGAQNLADPLNHETVKRISQGDSNSAKPSAKPPV